MGAVNRRIHHLNCASFCPPPARLPRFLPARLVAHCLLVEDDRGLTLVDTGLGRDDIANPKRLGTPTVVGLGPVLDPGETAVAQVRSLGFEPEDVRDIVLTHLDGDHAGGISDFPRARVHVFDEELDAARRRRSAREKGRYVPAQWAHGPNWVEHSGGGGETWFGFEAVHGLGEDVLMVPLRGHTRGHVAVAVARPEGGWFLHCGDAYFFHAEKERPSSCPPGLRGFQAIVQMDRADRLANLERLRTLHADHGDEVTLFCAHDEQEYAALASVTV
jgi:glyoxylase-like metal-dependent hydrolase (beta-lactamase superfamily II)